MRDALPPSQTMRLYDDAARHHDVQWGREQRGRSGACTAVKDPLATAYRALHQELTSMLIAVSGRVVLPLRLPGRFDESRRPAVTGTRTNCSEVARRIRVASGSEVAVSGR